ncbi:PAS domain S-box protein [Terrilactibacillus sp. BCM23-1]|uniref:PAS domain S-box protein n=1 Tax=Terrilactibacillus tamarindi TaxID=2599694 RepID=A0A6N8CRV9_9BACI|nr:sigma 54-interacting transcriptional regulator [Terrilactibacillus tamarindi]MTT32410.1 PAS domain S-box protein [Terrilactibacillus tamarindi]
MKLFYQNLLSSIKRPWVETLDVHNMKIVQEDDSNWSLELLEEQKDIALIDERGTCTGWILYSDILRSFMDYCQKVTSIHQTLMNTIDDAVTIVDKKGNVISWNSKAEALYQYSQKNMLGQPITHHFKKETIKLMDTLKKGEEVRNQYNQPKEHVHVLINTSPVRVNQEIVGGISVERDITEMVKLNEELSSSTAYIRHLENQFDNEHLSDPFQKIKGKSPMLNSAVKLAKKVAKTDVPVLITGESGVGKELFSTAIHHFSHRSNKPFIAINCGAIPTALFESELFGYEKGAFTGAVREGKKGKIDASKGGTLFLDEIGELPLDLQVKLLRVLQENQFYRVGGSKPIPTDIRIITATNRSLEQMIQDGNFRLDLYYRLNVVTIQLPALRERIEDIPEFIHLFLEEFALKYNKKVPSIAPEALNLLMKHRWPGNIRQLRNTIERIMILLDGDVVRPDHLPESFYSKEISTITTEEEHVDSISEDVSIESERERIKKALKKTYGNKSAAAKLLAISRVTLYNRMKKYRLE